MTTIGLPVYMVIVPITSPPNWQRMTSVRGDIYLALFISVFEKRCKNNKMYAHAHEISKNKRFHNLRK